MRRDILIAGLFNTIFGALSFFVIAPSIMSFIYVADLMDWITDPTLEPGMLPVFLLITMVFSITYYPFLIYVNINCWKKTGFKKKNYSFLAMITWLLGLSAFYITIRSL